MPDKTKQPTRSPIQSLFMVSGIVAVVIGLIGISFGSGWSTHAFDFLAGIKIVELIDTYAPYFPFVPFYPMFLIMLGAFLIVKSRG
jgi:hypothetical protein